MGFPKKITQASAVVSTLLVAVLLGALPFSARAQGRRSTADIDQLRHKAWKQGKVQVIVHFAVPRLVELSASSAKYWGTDLSTDDAQARSIADSDLANAVEYSSWKILAELQGTEFEEVARFQYLPFIVLRVSPGAFAVLEASSDVLGIEEDYPVKLVEPVAGTGEGIKGGNADGDKLARPMLDDSAGLIGAETAWGWGFTGKGWYVAILDTGIRRTHRFFSGKTIVEACRAKGRDGAGPGGDCPNGKSSQNGRGSAVHYASTYGGWDHGTHVAGIAAGSYGSLAGIAKGANIIAVKIFSKFTAGDCDGSPCVMCWNSDTVAGMEYVYSLRTSYNIAAVNLSLGGGRYGAACNGDSHRAAVDLLRSAGIATAAATGNNSYCNAVSSPACVSSSVAVGSSTKSDEESSFNNWHKTMQKLFAPGTSIYSSTGVSDSSYESWSGTSMATPHVTGAWALMKQALPTASVTSLLSALRSTGTGIKSPCDGYTTSIPRIQVDEAISALAVYRLTIQAGGNGTTSPVPGTYTHAPGTRVKVTAVPKTNYEFVNWTGDISSTQNPVTVTLSETMTIKANFRIKPKLTISANGFGTTDPSPGGYYYATGTQVPITPLPKTYCTFVSWSGSATGSAEPLVLTMNGNKSVAAYFRYIFAPAASGQKVLNRSYSQAEHINILSWQADPANAGLDIAKYKIYLMANGTPSFLAEVGADQSQYSHRKAGQAPLQYAIVAVTRTGREGAPASVSVQ